MKNRTSKWINLVIPSGLLLLFILFFQAAKFYLYKIFEIDSSWDAHYDLLKLIFQHLNIVLCSSSISVILGLSIGIFCSTAFGSEMKSVIEKLTYLGHMIPTLALLSFMVPIFGLGVKPAIIALIIIGTLPIYVGTISGIESVPQNIIEVAQGIGMTDKQVLCKVKLPLALPVIVSGLRTSLIINISAATLAANVGGGGLGILLLSALRSMNDISIIEGTVPICLLAIIVDRLLENIEKIFAIKYISED